MKLISLMLVVSFLLPMIVLSQGREAVLQNIRQKFSAFEGTFALAVHEYATDTDLLINEREVFHAASTMKTPVMIEVFRQANEGAFALSDSLPVKNEFRSIVDGSRYAMDMGEDSDDSMYEKIGGKATIHELTYQMITVSSNLATNILIDLVGAENVARTMRSIGANDIQVLRGVEDMKAFRLGKNNTTTALDLMIIMRAIQEHKVVDPASCEAMIDILSDQHFHDVIPGKLPRSAKVAHKTGSITGVHHDSGIVYPEGKPPYVVVLLSKDVKDAEGVRAMLSDVSRLVYDYCVQR